MTMLEDHPFNLEIRSVLIWLRKRLHRLNRRTSAECVRHRKVPANNKDTSGKRNLSPFLVVSILIVSLSVCIRPANAFLYDTGRHYSADDPILACKADLTTGYTCPGTTCSYPNQNYAGIEWVGNGYSCKCYSNPGATCVAILRMCPPGFVNGACHQQPEISGLPGSGHGLLCNANFSCVRQGLDPEKNLGKPCAPLGGSPLDNGTNPVNSFTGNKFQEESDLNGDGRLLTLRRYYNSHSNEPDLGFGNKWRSEYAHYVKSEIGQFLNGDIQIAQSISTVAVTASVYRGSGAKYLFTNSYDVSVQSTISEKWQTDADVHGELRTRNIGGVFLGFEYRAENGDIEFYDAAGRLQSIVDLRGNARTLLYDANARLERVNTNTGEYLQFSYDADNRITSITDDTGRVWGYRYDAVGNLEYLDSPDNSTKQYHYEDASFPSALTGITDERGVRFSVYG